MNIRVIELSKYKYNMLGSLTHNKYDYLLKYKYDNK